MPRHQLYVILYRDRWQNSMMLTFDTFKAMSILYNHPLAGAHSLVTRHYSGLELFEIGIKYVADEADI